jgi:hypothetical protein
MVPYIQESGPISFLCPYLDLRHPGAILRLGHCLRRVTVADYAGREAAAQHVRTTAY